MQIICKNCRHVFEGVMSKVLTNLGHDYFVVPQSRWLAHGFFEGEKLAFICPKCGEKNYKEI